MYDIIKMIFDDISKELGLGLPYDLSELSQHNSGDFNGKMAIIESATGGTSYFLSRSKITKFDLPIQQDTPDPQLPLVQKVYHVEQLFKGWKNETSENFTTPIS
jgi:hypothetical protein